MLPKLGLYTLISSLLAGLGSCSILGSTGCAGKNSTWDQKEKARDQFVQTLKDGKFHGHAHYEGAGSPLQVYMLSQYGLGPNSTEGFDGEINFTPDTPK